MNRNRSKKEIHDNRNPNPLYHDTNSVIGKSHPMTIDIYRSKKEIHDNRNLNPLYHDTNSVIGKSHPMTIDSYLPMMIKGNNHHPGKTINPSKSSDSKVSILDPSMAKLGPNVNIPYRIENQPYSQLQPVVNTQTQTTNSEIPMTNSQIQIINSETQTTNSQTQTTNSEIQMINSEIQMINSEIKRINSEIQRLGSSIKDLSGKSNLSLISLIHYNIIGGKGWQRIFGYMRGTDIQPIQIIQDSKLYGISLSHSGIGTIPIGSIYICKNRETDYVPTDNDNYIIGIIRVKNEIVKPINKFIRSNEQDKELFWEIRSNVLKRNDRISIYAENISGSNLEIFIEYSS